MATRSTGKANGLGIEPREAVRKLESLEQAYCSLKPDPPSAAQRTKELIAQFALSDTRVHGLDPTVVSPGAIRSMGNAIGSLRADRSSLCGH